MQFNLHLHKFGHQLHSKTILPYFDAGRGLTLIEASGLSGDQCQGHLAAVRCVHSHETNGWKLKDLDGLSLLDHASLGGMRMLSPRRGSTRNGRHDN